MKIYEASNLLNHYCDILTESKTKFSKKDLLEKIRKSESRRDLMAIVDLVQDSGSSDLAQAWHEKEHELKFGGSNRSRTRQFS